MKAITCDMCGSRDIIKTDGLYVCQNCGTKYSPEAATKLIAEISGPISLDRTAEARNYVILARRSVVSKEYMQAKEYYYQALLINAKCWEAELFSLINSGIDDSNPLNKRKLVLQTTSLVLDDSKQNFEPDEQKELLKAVYEELKYLYDYLNRIAYYICNEGHGKKKHRPEYDKFLNNRKGHVNNLSDASTSTERFSVAASLIEYAVDIFETYGKQVISVFGKDFKIFTLAAYKLCFEIYNRYYETVDCLNNERRKSIIDYLCNNDDAFKENYLKELNIKKLEHMIVYFGKKQNLYDELDSANNKITAANGLVLQSVETSKIGFTMEIIGWILFALGVGIGFVLLIISIMKFIAGKVVIGILLLLGSLIAAVPGIVLIFEANKRKREYFSEFERVKKNNDLVKESDLVKSKISSIKTTLNRYYKEYGDCDVKLTDTNPKVLIKLKEIIKSGKANTIEEAVSYYHFKG